jgi:hypothetical protein
MPGQSPRSASCFLLFSSFSVYSPSIRSTQLCCSLHKQIKTPHLILKNKLLEIDSPVFLKALPALSFFKEEERYVLKSCHAKHQDITTRDRKV